MTLQSAVIRSLERGEPGAHRPAPRAAEWLRDLGGPTLIRIPGRDRSRVRIVTTLLHGNEPSGLRAMHRWLLANETPAVDCLFFIGAVETALADPGFAFRTLKGQTDMNRCWLPPYESPLGRMAEGLLEEFRSLTPEALIDMHNNTGHNPPYGVGPVADVRERALVSRFGNRFVHSNLRLGALVEATAPDYPSVTIECGRSGDPLADEVAYAGLKDFLESGEIFSTVAADEQMDILADPIRVCVKPDIPVAFGDEPVEGMGFTVVADIDRHNFERLGPGVPIGWIAEGAPWPLSALDEEGKECSHEMFVRREGRLETRTSITPIMMTTNPHNVALDCLFYSVRQSE